MTQNTYCLLTHSTSVNGPAITMALKGSRFLENSPGVWWIQGVDNARGLYDKIAQILPQGSFSLFPVDLTQINQVFVAEKVTGFLGIQKAAA
jgi:hypothetical protein